MLTERLPRRGRRNRPGGRLQPPDESPGNHQTNGDQLGAGHDSAKYRAAPRIVAEEFQEIPGTTVEDEKGGQHLPVEFLALEQPHQNKEIRQFNRRFEKLRGFERYSQRRVGIQVGNRIGKRHAPEVTGRLAITASCGETSYSSDGVTHREAGRKSVPGGKRRHTMPADVPDRSGGSTQQPAGK